MVTMWREQVATTGRTPGPDQAPEAGSLDWVLADATHTRDPRLCGSAPAPAPRVRPANLSPHLYPLLGRSGWCPAGAQPRSFSPEEGSQATSTPTTYPAWARG